MDVVKYDMSLPTLKAGPRMVEASKKAENKASVTEVELRYGAGWEQRYSPDQPREPDGKWGSGGAQIKGIVKKWQQVPQHNVKRIQAESSRYVKKGIGSKSDGASLIKEINNTHEKSIILYRGIGFKSSDDVPNSLERLKEGDTFEMTQVQSFSRNGAIAKQWAGFGGRARQFIFETNGPIKGIDVNGLGRNPTYSNEREYIVAGRFKIESLSTYGNVTLVGIRQVGTYD